MDTYEAPTTRTLSLPKTVPTGQAAYTGWLHTIEAQDASNIATICENAQLFGAAPERDEFDTREVWDEDDALPEEF